jgi:hypothetical protein
MRNHQKLDLLFGPESKLTFKSNPDADPSMESGDHHFFFLYGMIPSTDIGYFKIPSRILAGCRSWQNTVTINFKAIEPISGYGNIEEVVSTYTWSLMPLLLEPTADLKGVNLNGFCSFNINPQDVEIGINETVLIIDLSIGLMTLCHLPTKQGKGKIHSLLGRDFQVFETWDCRPSDFAIIREFETP